MIDSGSGEQPIRLSDRDREQAAQRLQRALGEGRITVGELDERMAQVYAARFPADLLPPLADLPGNPSAAVVPAPTAPMSNEVTVLSATSGHLRREGRWVVPPALRVEVGSGRATLDCTEAEIVSPRVTISVSVRSGTVVLRLPDGATANIDGVRVRSGSARSWVPAVGGSGALHLVINGDVQSGRLLVRGPRRGWFGGGQSASG